MTTTIYIDKNGNISGLSDSFFDRLNPLGQKQVQRVSDIEYNHELQQWEARTHAGFLIGRHGERDKLIAMEREYLNQKIETHFNAQTQNSGDDAPGTLPGFLHI